MLLGDCYGAVANEPRISPINMAYAGTFTSETHMKGLRVSLRDELLLSDLWRSSFPR